MNQYTNVGGVALGWDANGNPTNVVENGVALALTYDRENRLVRVDTGTVTVTNTYDAFHRLVERATASGKLRFVYDNRWRVIAEYDGGNTLVQKYVYGPEMDEPVRMTRMGVHRYYHQAALGTVTEMTARAGIVNERYTYDVYGQPTIRDSSGNVHTNAPSGNRFLFQGRDRDPDTGLYNFRYRTYSPTLGRFLQVDPIRIPDRFSVYCSHYNNPQSATDIFGLFGGWGSAGGYGQPGGPTGWHCGPPIPVPPGVLCRAGCAAAVAIGAALTCPATGPGVAACAAAWAVAGSICADACP